MNLLAISLGGIGILELVILMGLTLGFFAVVGTVVYFAAKAGQDGSE